MLANPWKGEAPITRSEFVDESKTRVFKCASNPNIVGGYFESVDMATLGPMLGNPAFLNLTKSLGEIEGSKVMNVVTQVQSPQGQSPQGQSPQAKAVSPGGLVVQQQVFQEPAAQQVT